jgi:uncharacterized protein with PQ loop repeat
VIFELTLHEAIGWIGSLMFAVCAVPQAITSHKQGHSSGLNWLFLGLWLGGEILTTIYIWPKQDWPLLTNYFINLACLAVILYYKVRPRTLS